MAPTFRRGFPATFGFVIAALMIIVVIQILALRERKKNLSADQETGSTAENASVDGSGSEGDGKTAAVVKERNSKELDAVDAVPGYKEKL